MRTTLSALLLFLASLPACAGESPKPFETRMDLGFLGFLGGSMEYWVDGSRVTRYEDFKARIYPLRDAEASRLIRESESAHVAAMVFYASGLAAGLDLALFFKPTPFLNNDLIDRAATGLIAVQIFAGLGALFDSNAEGRKYNAVQRYNRMAAEKGADALTPGLSWGRGRLEGSLALGF